MKLILLASLDSPPIIIGITTGIIQGIGGNKSIGKGTSGSGTGSEDVPSAFRKEKKIFFQPH